MRKFFRDFIHRGLIACGFGPMILAIIYLTLQKYHVIQMVTVNELCMGIFTLSVLAFVCGGMNCIYQVEQLPLMWAILLHVSVLYISYLVVYLLNGWLKWGVIPVFVFTGIFVFAYLIIWAIIYLIMKHRTARINKILKQKQQGMD